MCGPAPTIPIATTPEAISLIEGIKSKKQIKRLYATYENKFGGDVDLMSKQFDEVVQVIEMLYPEGVAHTEFHRIHVFYSLFTAVAHCLHGLPGLSAPRLSLGNSGSIQRARNGLDRVADIFDAAATEPATLTAGERTFIEDSRRATTDAPVRERRAEFLLSLMA